MNMHFTPQPLEIRRTLRIFVHNLVGGGVDVIAAEQLELIRV